MLAGLSQRISKACKIVDISAIFKILFIAAFRIANEINCCNSNWFTQCSFGLAHDSFQHKRTNN